MTPSRTGLMAAAIFGTCIFAQAQTPAIWHCSKQTALTDAASPVSMTQTAPKDTFQIASMSIDADVIGLTLIDIMDVYSGIPVRVSGRPLTACFINDQSNAGREMLEALGLNASTMSALSRKSAIVRSQLEWVSNEEGMLRCMVKHAPAVGYFREPKDTDDIAPCF